MGRRERWLVSFNPPLTQSLSRQAAGGVGIQSGRGERIRTSGLYVPNVALYQAKLHPESLLRTPQREILPLG